MGEEISILKGEIAWGAEPVTITVPEPVDHVVWLQT
jgi:hypothetical protein